MRSKHARLATPLGVATGLVAGFFLLPVGALLDPTDDQVVALAVAVVLAVGLPMLVFLAGRPVRRSYQAAVYGAACGVPVGLVAFVLVMIGLAEEIGYS